MKATTMKHGFQAVRTLPALAAAGLLAAALAPAAAADLPGGVEMRFELRPAPELAGPPLPPPGVFPVQLVLDDDTAEGTVGVSDASGAREFLWFNRFTPPGGAFDLEEIWVLFPPGVNMAVGDAVQLAVWLDPDGDPTNGANLLATFGETIQVIDGTTFSVYPLAPPVTIVDPGDVLIGVVPRFIAPGDPPTGPAAVDTTASQQRSWIAIWTGDPPDPPELPPDLVIDLIDNIAPAAAGNWMIRGFGGPPPAVVIPALDGSGLALLALALAAAGFVALRRLRKRHGAAALGMVVLAAAAALAPAAPASAQVVIDEFTTNQGPVVDPPGGGSTAVTGGADILGGKRGVRVRNLAGPGPTSVEVAFSILAFTVEDTTPDSLGEADVIWDGDADNNPFTFDPTGLGGVDLTDGGTDGGIRFTIEQARAGTHLALAIYEDADHVSRAGRVLPEITSTTTVFINFGELIADPDAIGPADLTQIGAVTLRLGAVGGPNPPTLEISQIETAPPAVAAVKIDTVGGVDPAGPVAPGTTLRYRVTIDNPGAGGAEGVDFDDLVTDPNLGAPGPFRSTPLARRDQYLTVTDTPIDSAADGVPSLLGNDADPDGDALAAVAATGQATAQGGSVDVAADGHFMYTPPMGFVGVDSFTYTLQATAGDPTTDAAGNPIGAAGSTAYVTIDRVPPEITAGGTLNYTENDPPTAIDPALTVVDVDSTNLFGATVQITGNYAMGEDVLGFVDAPPITGNWVPATGTLTLTGTDTVANYEAALRSVTYENTSDDPSTLQRTVTWTATDGSETSAPATSTINVTSVNDAPVITTTGGVTPFTEDGGPVVVDAALTVTDADDTNLESATVSLAAAPDGGAETLAVASPGANCPGLAVTPGNPLTIIGSALVATYETCLRNVTYDNTSQDPNTTDRTVQFVANDGDDDSNTATKTVTVTAVNDPPVAGDDAWDTIGNTQLVVDLAALATPHVLDTTTSGFGVLDNDADPAEGDALAVSGIVGCGDVTPPFVCPTVNGGSVTMEANGRFTFTPLAGDVAASDSFQYTVTDDGTPAPASDIGMVTLNLFERVWYVKNDAAAGGLGRSHEPFDTLAEAQTASLVNDWIFVYFGDGTSTGQAAGIVLKSGQHLIGEHHGLSIPVNLNTNGSPTVLHTGTPGSRPLIDHSGAGNSAVSATDAIPIEIVALNLMSTAENAIDLTTMAAFAGSGALTIGDNVVRGSGTEGVDVNHAGTGALTLAIHDNTVTAGGDGIDVLRTGGTMTITAFDDNVVHGNTGGSGIEVAGALFDATLGLPVQQVSGGVTVIGQMGNGVGTHGMLLTGVNGDLTFTDLDVFNDGGTGLRATSNGAFVAGTGAGFRIVVPAGVVTIDSNGGPAVDVNNASVTLPLSFLESTNSTTTGLSLVNAFGGAGLTALSVSSGQISDPGGASGTAVNVSGGNGNVTLGIPITNNSGNAVTISSRSTDTVVFTGAITETGSGVSLTGNSGSALMSFRGGLSANTGTNPAFRATGGGNVEVCDENPCNPGATGLLVNTLTTTTATALNVSNTTITANNLEFRSISSNGGSGNGIILSTTGSSGGLKVKGTGSAGSGGTIQNKTGGNGSTTDGTGIFLSSTSGVSLDRMQLNDFQNYAIRGLNVTGFSFTNSVVSGANGTTNAGPNEEDSIRFDGLFTSGSFPTVQITNSTISGGFTNNLRVRNVSGTLNRLLLSNNTFGLINAANGNDNVAVTAVPPSPTVATLNVTLEESTFLGTRGDFFETIADGNSTMDVVARRNKFTNGQAIIPGGGVALSIRGDVAGTADSVTFDLSCNNILGGHTSTGIFVAKGNGGGTWSGVIVNNPVGPASGAGGDGIFVRSAGSGTISLLIRDNQVSGYGNVGFHLQNNDGSATMNATIFGNLVSAPHANAFAGLFVDNGATATDTSTANVVVGSATVAANKNDFSAGDPANFSDVSLSNFNASTTFTLSRNGSANSTAAQIIDDDNLNPATTNTDTSGGVGAITAVNTLPTVPATPPACVVPP